MKTTRHSLFCLLLLCLLLSPIQEAHAKKRKKDQNISSEAGLRMPEWGIAIDAYYLPALDQLIPGYRVLNIVVQNSRQEAITLNPAEDKWFVVDNLGKKYKAYNHIKLFNKSLWDKMSEAAKNKLDYPNSVPPGKMVAIDVFFPSSVELHSFKEIVWDSDFFNKEFNILTAYESHISVEYSTSKVIEAPKDPAPQMPSQPEHEATQKEQDEYIKARDKFIGNHEKDVKKVFYISPDGTMQEVEEPVEGGE